MECFDFSFFYDFASRSVPVLDEYCSKKVSDPRIVTERRCTDMVIVLHAMGRG